MISKHRQCRWSLTALKIVKVYTCDVCHKHTQRNTTLSLASAGMQDLAGSKKQKRFHCSGCRRSFGQKSSLHVHRRKHSKSKPHSCTLCSKRFITQSGLAMHIKGHNSKQVDSCGSETSTDISDQDTNLKSVLNNQSDNDKAFPACTRLKELSKLVKNEENTMASAIKKEITNPEKVHERPKTRLFLSSKPKEKYSLLSKTCQHRIRSSSAVSTTPEKKCSKVNIDTYSPDYDASASNVISYIVNVEIGDTSKSVLLTSEKHDKEMSEFTRSMMNSFDDKTSSSNKIGMVKQENSESSILSGDVKAMRDENKSLAFKCKYCTESFESNELLVEHKKSHKTKRPVKVICPWTHCGKRLTSQKRLDSHLKRHNGETDYLCSKCGMHFTDCVFYHKHRIQCLQRCRTYTCNVCGKELSGYSALQKHHRVHTGEKPSQCEICGSRFNNNQHLTRHKRIHIRKGEIPPAEGYRAPDAVVEIMCSMPSVSRSQNYTQYNTCLEIGNQKVVAYCVDEENNYMATSQQTELLCATENVAKEMH